MHAGVVEDSRLAELVGRCPRHLFWMQEAIGWRHLGLGWLRVALPATVLLEVAHLPGLPLGAGESCLLAEGGFNTGDMEEREREESRHTLSLSLSLSITVSESRLHLFPVFAQYVLCLILLFHKTCIETIIHSHTHTTAQFVVLISSYVDVYNIILL